MHLHFRPSEKILNRALQPLHFQPSEKCWIDCFQPLHFRLSEKMLNRALQPLHFRPSEKMLNRAFQPLHFRSSEKMLNRAFQPLQFRLSEKMSNRAFQPLYFWLSEKMLNRALQPLHFLPSEKRWVTLSSPFTFCRQKNVESRSPALVLSAVGKMLSRVFQPFLPPLPPLLSYPPYSRLYRQHKVTQFVHKINLKMNLSFLIAKQVSGTEDQMERIERSLNFVSDGKSISLVRYVCKIYLDSECWHRVISPQRVSSSILKMCISKLTRAETPRTVLLAILNHFSVN